VHLQLIVSQIITCKNHAVLYGAQHLFLFYLFNRTTGYNTINHATQKPDRFKNYQAFSIISVLNATQLKN
jgi:hypothetical protein